MDWAAHREESKQRRADHRENSAQILRDRGVTFTTHNDGAHLIVEYPGGVADFWPGTGKYHLRSEVKYKRGVFNLLKDIGADHV